MSAAPTRCSRPRSPTGARSTPTPAQRFRFQHISTDEVFGSLGARRQVHRDHALRAQLALLREQGRIRPSGARLAPHLRPAGAHHQLLQQLRPVSLPREADPAGDHPRPARRAAAGLRQGRERARLAACRGPRRGADDGPAARAGRARATMSAATASGGTSTWCARSAACSTRCCPRARNRPHERLIEFVTDRPGPRRALRHRRLEDPPRARLAAASHDFDNGLRDTVRWFLDHKVWWERVMSGAYRGERLGLPG